MILWCPILIVKFRWLGEGVRGLSSVAYTWALSTIWNISVGNGNVCASLAIMPQVLWQTCSLWRDSWRLGCIRWDVCVFTSRQWTPELLLLWMPRPETTVACICISVSLLWLRLWDFWWWEHLPGMLSMKDKGSIWKRVWSAVSSGGKCPEQLPALPDVSILESPLPWLPGQRLNEWRTLLHRNHLLLSGWSTLVGDKAFGCFFCPGLVSQLQQYSETAPSLPLQQAKLMCIAAWKGMTEVVREHKCEGYESSSDRCFPEALVAFAWKVGIFIKHPSFQLYLSVSFDNTVGQMAAKNPIWSSHELYASW